MLYADFSLNNVLNLNLYVVYVVQAVFNSVKSAFIVSSFLGQNCGH